LLSSNVCGRLVHAVKYPISELSPSPKMPFA
jgi:hypothetical protein